MRAIGLLGGTFDPIHLGHLRTALELKQDLELDEMRLVPSHTPPHRGAPLCGAQDRLEMARLAVMGEPELQVDDCEFQRGGISYSVDTLQAARDTLGPDTAICLVVGMDAFANFEQWHEWRRILGLAHLVVVQRPGVDMPRRGAVVRLLNDRSCSSPVELKQSAQGRVLVLEMTPLGISATQIRELVGAGKSTGYLLPDSVRDYIASCDLYRGPDSDK